ncbi:DNA recombination protein RmuC [Sutterella sp. AM11-39]|uniref:DNA recombination protein RmuC n=1 Tax=Sutterella sp. AM11-39 TaxID=2292075 RepID=UPI0011C4464E|nr:DNA recombination protein RmuC [Sutterella sp. AM11-39]
MHELTLFLSQYSPVMLCAVLAVVVVLTAVVIYLAVRTADLKRNLEVSAETAKALSAQAAGTTIERIEALSRQMQAADSELKSSQSSHFVNFLGLINSGSQAQERRLAQMNETVQNAMMNVRASLNAELTAIREANDKALESMRNTVDEKLSATLNTRLTESFKTVEGQLLEVHRGLGEMREMAQNVDGLRRILTNVKTRGTFGEVQLAMILSDLLTPEQYDTNVATRPGSRDRVEFAVKLPGAQAGTHVLLPIDAKFPTEDYERLIEASDEADPEKEAAARRALQTRILTEAAKIRDKYIEVPYTTEFAVLYLPAESLWSEVLKINGLVERVQRDCHVTIVGPTVLAAFLNSLQMGFKTLAIEQKSAEVWRLLGEVKAEFGRFSESVGSMEKRIDSVKSAISAMRTRTNVMERKLKGVESVYAPAADERVSVPGPDGAND